MAIRVECSFYSYQSSGVLSETMYNEQIFFLYLFILALAVAVAITHLCKPFIFILLYVGYW